MYTNSFANGNLIWTIILLSTSTHNRHNHQRWSGFVAIRPIKSIGFIKMVLWSFPIIRVMRHVFPVPHYVLLFSAFFFLLLHLCSEFCMKHARVLQLQAFRLKFIRIMVDFFSFLCVCIFLDALAISLSLFIAHFFRLCFLNRWRRCFYKFKYKNMSQVEVQMSDFCCGIECMTLFLLWEEKERLRSFLIFDAVLQTHEITLMLILMLMLSHTHTHFHWHVLCERHLNCNWKTAIWTAPPTNHRNILTTYKRASKRAHRFVQCMQPAVRVINSLCANIYHS